MVDRRKADAILIDTLTIFAETADDGLKSRRFYTQGMREIVDGGADRGRANLLIPFTACDEIGFR